MKVCIHRGANQIGGTCVEIEAQGKRIVLDVGLPLDAHDPDSIPLHEIKGFDRPDDSLLGVIISHPHQDHYGLAHRLPEQTPFLIGKAAEAILSAAVLFTRSGLNLKHVTHLVDRTPIVLGPFTITPFLVDHSAYDAYAVLVEADGKRLFYTGDFRAHGRKSKLTDQLIDDPPKDVDILLMEGTCIGREDQQFKTEDDLVPRFADIFKDTPGMPLVWCSGQNLDRIVTIFKACRKSGRQFIIDLYTAEMLRATGNEHMPQASWDGIRVFLPFNQKLKIKSEKAFEVSNPYSPYRIYRETFAEVAAKSVLLFRPNMVRELERVKCLTGACVVCSEWQGYLEKESNKWFAEWLKGTGTPLKTCHTSGHASIPDLRRMREAFPGATVVPVHLDDRGRFVDLFDNVKLREDKEWWGVQ
jgi:ribonuclease J